MGKVNVIAIDGPAGSGKSTVARQLAEKLGYLYMDTGAMYRALTLKAINEKIDFTDEQALVDLSQNTDIALRETPSGLRVYLDRKDVSERIRTMEVTKRVKSLASLKGVRDNMVKLQRRLGQSSTGAVLEGRDIGTVVFPDAAYKFYLDAGYETRAKRRYEELKQKGFSVSLDEIKQDVEERDASDMTRSIGPLKKAEDAKVIDTTDMTVGEVVGRILGLIEENK